MNNTPWTSSPFFWIILWVFIWPLFWMFIRRMNQKGMTHKSAMEILKERYAKGEITKDEFEEKKKDIA